MKVDVRHFADQFVCLSGRATGYLFNVVDYIKTDLF